MTPHSPKTCWRRSGRRNSASEIPNLPRGDVRESRRVARIAHRRGASICRLLTGFSLLTTVNWKLKILQLASPPPGRSRRRIAAARPIPPQPRPKKHDFTQRSGISVRRGGRVRSAARAPAVARRVFFVYDNNNGTHPQVMHR